MAKNEKEVQQQSNVTPISGEKYFGDFSRQEVQTIKDTYCVNATDSEFKLFLNVASNSGLNPFKGHIYFIKYGGQMSIQTSVEGITHLARQHPDFLGYEAQIVGENEVDEFDAEYADGKWVINQHKIHFPRGKTIGCYAIVKRENMEDKVEFMDVSEVEHFKNKKGSQWGEYFNDMFKKHVLKRAMKAQFGVEDPEDQSVNETAYESVPSYEERQRVDISPDEIQTGDDETANEDEELKNQWEELTGKLKKYDMGKAELKKMIQEKYNMKPADLSLQQVIGLSKVIDLEQSQKVQQPADSKAESKDDDEDFADFFENADQQNLF